MLVKRHYENTPEFFTTPVVATGDGQIYVHFLTVL